MAEAVIVPTPRAPDLATFTLLSGGERVPATFHLLNATVTFAVNKVPFARFVFRDGSVPDQTFPASESDHFTPGAEIELRLGYHEEESPVFRGVVTRHAIRARSGRPHQLEVECRHPVFMMTLGRKSRQFTDQTDSDIASLLLQEHGVTGDVEDSSVTHPQMVQFRCTDWDFLLLRARANGRLVIPLLEEVRWAAPNLEGDPALELAYGTCLEAFEAELEARNQAATATSRAWNHGAQEAIEFTAESAAESEAGNPNAADLAGTAGNFDDADWHAGAAATDEIQAWAEARLAGARLAKVRGSATCQGFAEIWPGDMVELQGLGMRFNGRAFVGGVRHEYALGVWKTHLQIGIDPEWFTWGADEVRTAAGLLPSPEGLHIGVVRQLENDPARGERVLVQLPVSLPGGEGLWARLATLEAGNGRGFVFRPDIGDEVVVGFFGDDPRHPVVLGALHSGPKAAHLQAADANDQKGYLSRAGLKLYFDDAGKVVTLATRAGNQLVLSEKDKGITLKDQNGNSIVLAPAGITIESPRKIQIKAGTDLKAEGMNVGMKASASAKLEGSASTTVSSSGQMSVKGSIVQIN